MDQFSDLAVGADGTVYVSWQRCPANGQAGDCGGTVATFLLSKSTDGGNTWSAPVTISTPTLVPDFCGCGFYGCMPNTDERISNIATNAVFGSGSTAKVYVSFYNWSGSQMQVFWRSTDGGNTFGNPVRVSNSNKGDEFFQWINVAKNGAIGVTGSTVRTILLTLNTSPLLPFPPTGVRLSRAARFQPPCRIRWMMVLAVASWATTDAMCSTGVRCSRFGWTCEPTFPRTRWAELNSDPRSVAELPPDPRRG